MEHCIDYELFPEDINEFHINKSLIKNSMEKILKKEEYRENAVYHAKLSNSKVKLILIPKSKLEKILKCLNED